MSEYVKTGAEAAALLLEIIGIAVVVGVALYVIILAVRQLFSRTDRGEIYSHVRDTLGRGILLGLEFLVAADIINTVAVELTLQSVATLAIIVLVRTFLSFAIEVEITGHWPWQADEKKRGNE